MSLKKYMCKTENILQMDAKFAKAFYKRDAELAAKLQMEEERMFFEEQEKRKELLKTDRIIAAAIENEVRLESDANEVYLNLLLNEFVMFSLFFSFCELM